jgi:hypothetical protein
MKVAKVVSIVTAGERREGRNEWNWALEGNGAGGEESSNQRPLHQSLFYVFSHGSNCHCNQQIVTKA